MEEKLDILNDDFFDIHNNLDDNDLLDDLDSLDLLQELSCDFPEENINVQSILQTYQVPNSQSDFTETDENELQSRKEILEPQYNIENSDLNNFSNCNTEQVLLKRDKLVNVNSKGSRNKQLKPITSHMQPILPATSNTIDIIRNPTLAATLIDVHSNIPNEFNYDQNGHQHHRKGVRKNSHNAIEKRYRLSINDKIDELRAMLFEGDDGKMNKSAVLKRAIDRLIELEDQNALLRSENYKLKIELDPTGLGGCTRRTTNSSSKNSTSCSSIAVTERSPSDGNDNDSQRNLNRHLQNRHIQLDMNKGGGANECGNVSGSSSSTSVYDDSNSLTFGSSSSNSNDSSPISVSIGHNHCNDADILNQQQQQQQQQHQQQRKMHNYSDTTPHFQRAKSSNKRSLICDALNSPYSASGVKNEKLARLLLDSNDTNNSSQQISGVRREEVRDNTNRSITIGLNINGNGRYTIAGSSAVAGSTNYYNRSIQPKSIQQNVLSTSSTSTSSSSRGTPNFLFCIMALFIVSFQPMNFIINSNKIGGYNYGMMDTGTSRGRHLLAQKPQIEIDGDSPMNGWSGGKFSTLILTLVHWFVAILLIWNSSSSRKYKIKLRLVHRIRIQIYRITHWLFTRFINLIIFQLPAVPVSETILEQNGKKQLLRYNDLVMNIEKYYCEIHNCNSIKTLIQIISFLVATIFRFFIPKNIGHNRSSYEQQLLLFIRMVEYINRGKLSMPLLQKMWYYNGLIYFNMICRQSKNGYLARLVLAQSFKNRFIRAKILKQTHLSEMYSNKLYTSFVYEANFGQVLHTLEHNLLGVTIDSNKIDNLSCYYSSFMLSTITRLLLKLSRNFNLDEEDKEVIKWLMDNKCSGGNDDSLSVTGVREWGRIWCQIILNLSRKCGIDWKIYEQVGQLILFYNKLGVIKKSGNIVHILTVMLRCLESMGQTNNSGEQLELYRLVSELIISFTGMQHSNKNETCQQDNCTIGAKSTTDQVKPAQNCANTLAVAQPLLRFCFDLIYNDISKSVIKNSYSGLCCDNENNNWCIFFSQRYLDLLTFLLNTTTKMSTREMINYRESYRNYLNDSTINFTSAIAVTDDNCYLDCYWIRCEVSKFSELLETVCDINPQRHIHIGDSQCQDLLMSPLYESASQEDNKRQTMRVMNNIIIEAYASDSRRSI